MSTKQHTILKCPNCLSGEIGYSVDKNFPYSCNSCRFDFDLDSAQKAYDKVISAMDERAIIALERSIKDLLLAVKLERPDYKLVIARVQDAKAKYNASGSNEHNRLINLYEIIFNDSSLETFRHYYKSLTNTSISFIEHSIKEIIRLAMSHVYIQAAREMIDKFAVNNIELKNLTVQAEKDIDNGRYSARGKKVFIS